MLESRIPKSFNTSLVVIRLPVVSVYVKVKVAVVSVPVSNSYELLPRTSAGKPQPPTTMPNHDSNLPVNSRKLTTLGGDRSWAQQDARPPR